MSDNCEKPPEPECPEPKKEPECPLPKKEPECPAPVQKKKRKCQKDSQQNVSCPELPKQKSFGFLKLPHQVTVLRHFLPSAIIYSVASALCVIYLADWQAVLQYVPFYNGKYNLEEKKD